MIKALLWLYATGENSLMEKERATAISKYLSLVLRHNPAAAGVTLDAEGWVGVEDLLAGAARHGYSFTRAELEEVVQKNEKQRFAFSLDSQRIRANQGHSVSVDLRQRSLAHRARPAAIHLKTLSRPTVIILLQQLFDDASKEFRHDEVAAS